MGIRCITCTKELSSLLDRCSCLKKKAKWKENFESRKKITKAWFKFIGAKRMGMENQTQHL